MSYVIDSSSNPQVINQSRYVIDSAANPQVENLSRYVVGSSANPQVVPGGSDVAPLPPVDLAARLAAALRGY
jgi:hypothetical protein